MLEEGDELDFGHTGFFTKPNLSFLENSQKGRIFLSDNNTDIAGHST